MALTLYQKTEANSCHPYRLIIRSPASSSSSQNNLSDTNSSSKLLIEDLLVYRLVQVYIIVCRAITGSYVLPVNTGRQ
jgi:hypothetical protein